MSYRPLALVSGLTLGDYLLWNWSLNANHDVLALVSGLTLPPLALVFLATLAVSLLRMIGGSARHSRRSAPRARSGAARDSHASESGHAVSPTSTGSSRSSSGKLAA